MSDENNVVFDEHPMRLKENKAFSPESPLEKWFMKKTGLSLSVLRKTLVITSLLFFTAAIAIFFLAYYRLSI